MTRAHGSARRTAGLLLLVLTALAGVLAPPPARAARAADGSPVQVVVESMAPAVARTKDDVLTIRFRLVNTTGVALDQVTVRAKVASPITLRDELATSTSEGTARRPVATVADVPANGQASGEFKATAAELGLTETDVAVYALTLDVTDNGKRVASTRLLLPWIPAGKAPAAKQQIAVLWPLIDRARWDGTTIGDTGQTPVFTDDGLNAELGPDGRLERLVEIGDGLPGAVWVVDPDLLATANEMAKGYRVAPPRPPETGKETDDAASGKSKGDGDTDSKDDKDSKGSSKDRDGRTDVAATKSTPRTEAATAPGTGGPGAAAWLEQLRKAAAADTVVALPYADTDLASIAHVAAGGKTDLTPILLRTVAEGGRVAGELLGFTVRSDVAWPIAGAVDEQVLTTAKNTGSKLVIASSTSVPPRSGKLTYTPSAHTPTNVGPEALIADARISDMLAAATENPPASPVALKQALLAELLTIANEEPMLARSLLIAPPRHFAAPVAQALKDAVTEATGTAGWAEPGTLDKIAATAPTEVEQRTIKGYPQELRRTELSAGYQQSIADLQQSVDTFAAILSNPERITRPYNPAVERALSVGWRTTPTLDANKYRIDVTRSLRVLEQLVRIVPKAGVTLSGDSGTIPVTIINGLQQAITIRLEVTSRQPNRLTLTQPAVTTIPGGVTSAIPIPAESAANGKVLVDVRVMTPDGQHTFGAAHSFYVNTTSIDGITLGIIGVIAGLLALFSLRAYLRRRRAAADGGPGDGTDGEADEGGDDEGADGPHGTEAPEHDAHDEQDEGDGRRHARRNRPEGHHAPA
ncbi:DUF6049 family protein [Yinghuangia soli]|uniref:DUF6049 family protein n=1 Tax=Yinghuangia soli TaxID=2908204 RepID=A0AA41QAS8_9ACTN|nr:DUF6049 family protein [Yinghuangia soli]MCF2533886.1 DUF6049 family protein [Yinghuangia soli]